MIKIFLPWPPKELNPNERVASPLKTKAKKAHKAACFEAAQAVTASFKTDNSKIPVKLVFVPPAYRGDIDNMLAAMKWGLDGVSEALQVNDKRFRPMLLDDAKPDSRFPRVEMYIKTNEK